MDNNPWDPVEYDNRFGFVTRLGGDLVAELDPQSGERVVDIGCGTGHLTAAVAAAGADVVGVDADPQMLRRAAADHPQLQWVAADAQEPLTPLLGEGSFDAALSNAALHWMPRQAEALRSIRDVLRPGGRFVAEMGGAGNIAAVDASLRTALAASGLDEAVGGNFFPTSAEEAGLLEAAGFRVESLRWFERPTPLQGSDTVADWVAHFRATVWAAVPPPLREQVAQRLLREAAAAGLVRDGVWHIDYCRLRFTATAV